MNQPVRELRHLIILPVFCLLIATSNLTFAQPTVQIGRNFLGSTYGVNTQAIPADPNGVIGPRHFMEFINGTVAIYNKTNGVRVQRKTDIKFWSDAGLIISPDSGVTDPRVIYDPTVQRWFASQIDFDASAAGGGSDPTLEANDFLFAVSATSDPTGAWRAFLFQSDPDTGYFADFPTLGVDSQAVYLSGDFYQGELNPLGAGLVSIPKSDLLSSTPTIANRTWFGIMDYSERGEVLQPAICFDGSSTGSVLALGNIGTDSEVLVHSNVMSFAVQNAAGPGAATLTASTSITVLPYEVPYNADMGVPVFTAQQPDGTTTLQGNDARLSAKVYSVGGVLHAVHNTLLNNRMAIRWYRINAASHTLVESGTIADQDLELLFPSIAANANGTVVIAFNACGPSTYLGCYAVAGQTLNGVTSFGDRIVLQAGTINYHGLDEVLAGLLDEPPFSRWGDYSATSVDPADPSRFWTIQMYPSEPGDLGDIWSTRVTELIVSQLPRLSVALAGPNLAVSWPSASGAFQLQSASAVSSMTSWSTVGQTPSTNNGLVSVSVPHTGLQQFFRLKPDP